MLDHDLIRREPSEWSYPVTSQRKPDGKIRFCVDFRKVNALSKENTYPLPRVNDLVDKIEAATYITKVDLVKEYWQVPLSKRAKQVASFVVNGAVYQCHLPEIDGQTGGGCEELCRGEAVVQWSSARVYKPRIPGSNPRYTLTTFHSLIASLSGQRLSKLRPYCPQTGLTTFICI